MISKKTLMQLISYEFNPIAVAIPFLQLAVYLANRNLGFVYLITSVSLQSILPTLGTFFLIYIKQVDDFDLTNREKRYKLLIPASILYLAMVFLSPDLYTRLINLSLLLGILLLTFINISWKISGHMILDTIVWINLAFLVHPAFFIAVIILPLIAYSRIYLKKHTLMQVTTGFLLGAVISLMMIYIYTNTSLV